jgi:hypothetical protein
MHPSHQNQKNPHLHSHSYKRRNNQTSPPAQKPASQHKLSCAHLEKVLPPQKTAVGPTMPTQKAPHQSSHHAGSGAHPATEAHHALERNQTAGLPLDDSAEGEENYY